MSLTAYDLPLSAVLYFKYLVQDLSESNDECPELVHSIRKACSNWERLLWVIRRRG